MPKVTVEDQDIHFNAPPSSNLRVELLKHKAKIYHGFLNKMFNCRGHGMCGTCLVRVSSNPAGLTDRTDVEKSKLFGANPNTRLACQAEICGDVGINCEPETLGKQTEESATQS